MFVAAAGAYVHVVTHFLQVRALSPSWWGTDRSGKKPAQQGGASLYPSLILFRSLQSALSQTQLVTKDMQSHLNFLAAVSSLGTENRMS